jgi:hypothetical protein
MAVKLLSSSGGSVTLDVPVTASNFALTVPAANGIMITTGSTGQIIPKAALPTGSVIQTLNAISPYNTNITVTNSSSGQSALYNTDVSSRVYGDLVSITITPTFSTSKFLVLATTGASSGTAGTLTAYGIVLVVNNSTGIGFGGDYPFYPLGSSLGNVYLPDLSMNAYYVPESASAFTVYLKGYSYSEPGSGGQITRFRNANLTVMEIA